MYTPLPTGRIAICIVFFCPGTGCILPALTTLPVESSICADESVGSGVSVNTIVTDRGACATIAPSAGVDDDRSACALAVAEVSSRAAEASVTTTAAAAE